MTDVNGNYSSTNVAGGHGYDVHAIGPSGWDNAIYYNAAVSNGSSTTVTSAIPKGAGSVGELARPIFPKTLTTSGNFLSSRSMACRMTADSFSDMPGGAVGMFHAVGSTPEAATLDDALQGVAPGRRVEVTPERLRAARDLLQTAPPGNALDGVCVGTPHASADELRRIAAALNGRPPFPWQDRGTYHQVVEVSGHR